MWNIGKKEISIKNSVIKAVFFNSHKENNRIVFLIKWYFISNDYKEMIVDSNGCKEIAPIIGKQIFIQSVSLENLGYLWVAQQSILVWVKINHSVSAPKDLHLCKCEMDIGDQWGLTCYVLRWFSQTKGINVNGGDILWIINRAWETASNTNYSQSIKKKLFFLSYFFLVFF